MIFDSHMHVGSFESMFGVSLDRDGIQELMHENEISNGVVFHPDNGYVRDVVESIPGLYGLVWANPRLPGYVEEAEEFLDHPKFLGMKMHPLLDGFHPNDPSVHPLIELLVVIAIIAVLIALVISGNFSIVGIIAGGVVPFLAGIAGGWLGERRQGTV